MIPFSYTFLFLNHSTFNRTSISIIQSLTIYFFSLIFLLLILPFFLILLFLLLFLLPLLPVFLLLLIFCKTVFPFPLSSSSTHSFILRPVTLACYFLSSRWVYKLKKRKKGKKNEEKKIYFLITIINCISVSGESGGL